jgi:hypothetical protein
LPELTYPWVGPVRPVGTASNALEGPSSWCFSWGAGMSWFGAQTVVLGIGDKIALPDDTVIAIPERFDPILLIPATYRHPADDLVCTVQGSAGVLFRVDGLAVVELV